jgi:hypothetical protein
MNLYLEDIAEVSQHLDALFRGLRSASHGKMSKTCDDGVKEKLVLIFRKVYIIALPCHYDRKLALHATSCLLKISSTCGIAFAAGQYGVG